MGKSHLFLTCLLAMSCLFVQAQPQVGSFSITPKVGLNMSTLWGDDTPVYAIFFNAKYFDSEATSSEMEEAYNDSYNYSELHEGESHLSFNFALGVDVQKQFSRRTGLSVGAYYAKKEIKFKFTGDDVFQCKKFKTTLNYIQVPFQWKLYIQKGLALQAGVQLDCLTKYKTIFRTTIHDLPLDNNNTAILAVNSQDNTKRYVAAVYQSEDKPDWDFDIAVPVGLSYEYNQWVAEFRCDFPVTRVYDYESVKQFNFSCLFTLGYRFELSKSVEK